MLALDMNAVNYIYSTEYKTVTNTKNPASYKITIWQYT